MIKLNDIVGGVFVLVVVLIWITLIGLAELAGAATLQPGQSLTVKCKAGGAIFAVR